MSGPVFMYRKGEARMFASPEEIPAGEGWQDTPVAEAAEPDIPAEPPAAVAADDAPDEIDVWRARATELGIKVDGRWSIAKLKKKIEAEEAT